MSLVDLPLGVDLGSERVRVARVQRTRSGETRLCAVAAAEVACAETDETTRDADAIAGVLESLRRETGARQRRCVAALDGRAAAVACVRFPRMPHNELKRAARFEAERTAPADLREVPTVVRITRWGDAGDYTIGIARADELRRRTASLRRAGLRPIAVDYDGFALRRALPRFDAVIDAGSAAVRLHAFGPGSISSWSVTGGGRDVTRAIAADLSIDLLEAERRKRSIGLAGAGESAMGDLLSGLCDALARVRERITVRRIALFGNASRLPGLETMFTDRLGASVEMGASALLFDGAYPSDVARAAAPDWTLAAALACWGLFRESF